MMNSNRKPPKKKKIRIAKPLVGEGENHALWREVTKYAEAIASVPDPNFNRVQEIKAEMRIKGTYEVTPEILEETAAMLSMRFMKPEL